MRDGGHARMQMFFLRCERDSTHARTDTHSILVYTQRAWPAQRKRRRPGLCAAKQADARKAVVAQARARSDEAIRAGAGVEEVWRPRYVCWRSWSSSAWQVQSE